MLDIPEIDMIENHTEDNTPHVDVQRGVFITSLGTEIPLSGKKISMLMLERVVSAGRPKAPHIEVTLLGKHKEIQENRNDPSYLAALEEWKGESNLRTMRYVFVIGVKGEPPEDFVDEQRQFFPDATDTDLKYLWVTSLVPDSDVEVFSEALLGAAMATAKGLEEAANFTASA